MSHSTLCRLCVSPSTEFKALFDDSGQPNGIYKIAAKYFDSILLNPEYNHTPKVICVECWQHIEDFHRFQLSVINSQTQLESQQPILCLPRLEDGVFNKINDDMGKHTIATSLTVFDRRQVDDISSDDQLNSVRNRFQQPFVNSPTLQQITSNSRLEDEILIEKFDKYEEPSVAAVLASDIMPIDDIPINTQVNPVTVVPPVNSISVFELIQIHDKLPNVPSNVNPNARRRKIEIDECVAKWKGELNCLECKKKFATYTLLTKHFRLEHPDVKCYTICCGVKIILRSSLIKHIQKFHMGKPLRLKKCKFCKATFENGEQLSNHVATECRKGTIAYNCNICLDVFRKEINLREHYRLKHKNTPLPTYNCPQCNKILKTQHNLEIHKKTVHSKEAPKKGLNAQKILKTQHKKKLHSKAAPKKGLNTQLSTDFMLDEKGKNNEKNEFIDLNNTPQTKCSEDNSHNLKEFLTDDEEEFQNKQTALPVPKLIYFTKRTTNKIQTESVKDSPTINYIRNDEISIHSSNIDSEKEQSKLPTSEYQENNNSEVLTPDLLTKSCSKSAATSDYQENNNFEDLTPDALAKMCSKSTESKLRYDAFIRKIKGDLECPKCPQEMLENYSMLTKHFSIKHGNETPFITCCNFKLVTRHRICVHLCLHLNPNAYQCDICKKCFANYWKLKAHKRYKHEGEIFCGRHRKSHRELASEIYDRSDCCTRKKLFMEHNDFIAKYKGELECRCCKAKFAYFSMLEYHFQCEHPKEKFYLECCKRKWEKMTTASRHMRKHSLKKQFKCEICKSSFQYRETLNTHIRIFHRKHVL